MKKSILSLVLASVCGLSALPASAADGTLTFSGEITDTVCNVSLVSTAAGTVVNDKNMTVDFSKIGANDITADKTLAERDFKLKLTNCPTGGTPATKVGVLMEGASDNDNFINQLKSEGAEIAATGLGVKISEGDKAITPNADAVMKDILADGTVEIDYKAQLVATQDKPGAGKFSTAVNYTLNYQ
ncbi:fimbrial protein [Salmonella enterica]